MADFSPRLLWPLPSPDEDPWFDSFESLIAAIDASVYGPAREDRNMLLVSTATVGFTAGSGVLTWDGAVAFLCAPLGFFWNLPAGSATLADGQILYAQVPRAPTSNVNLTPQVASTPSPQQDAADTLVIAVRRGNTVFWRNGKTISTGESVAIFSLTGGGGGVAIPRSGLYFAIGAASSYPGQSYYVETGTNAGNLYQSVATGSGAYTWKLIDFTAYAPLDSTCRVSFEFADASGAATIANGGAAGGTLTKAGSPTIADYSILGLRGLTCPTSSDYYAGLDAETVGAAYSAEAWISGGSGSGLQTILCRRADVASWSSPFSALALDLSGAQLRTFTGTTTGFFAGVAGSVPTTAVTHVAQTWSAATNLLLGYVNGALVSSTATTGTMVTNSAGRWGVGQIPQGGGAGSEPFGGIIYMARAYNAVLSPVQIQERWARGVRMYRA